MKKVFFMLRKIFRDLFVRQMSPLGEWDGNSLGAYYFRFILDKKKVNRLIADFDEDGVPFNTTYIDVEEAKLHYYPITIGQYALAVFHAYLDTEEEAHKAHFLRIADWFCAHSTEDEKLGVYWLTDVPKPEYRVYEPWKSAFSQSRGLSVLLRAWQLTGEAKYLALAKKALLPFTYDIAEGGVAVDMTADAALYEEYVAAKPTRVLDGHNFSLFGVYDAVRAITPEVDEEAHQLARSIFDKGIQGLIQRLPDYDMGYWMQFNLCDLDFYPPADPCTIAYLRIVKAQLQIFNAISPHPVLENYVDKLKHYDRLPNIIKMYRQKFKALRQMNRL